MMLKLATSRDFAFSESDVFFAWSCLVVVDGLRISCRCDAANRSVVEQTIAESIIRADATFPIDRPQRCRRCRKTDVRGTVLEKG